MPQLNTATWVITILSMIISLFMFLQLNISTYLYYPYTTQTTCPKTMKQKSPWEKNEQKFIHLFHHT